MRISKEPGSIVTEHLGGLLGVAVRALAARPLAVATEEAFAAADVEGHHHPIADLELTVFGPDFYDFAHEFVAENVA